MYYGALNGFCYRKVIGVASKSEHLQARDSELPPIDPSIVTNYLLGGATWDTEHAVYRSFASTSR